MNEENLICDMDIFKDALMDDNISVQVDAIKMLTSLSAQLGVEKTREEVIPCLVNCVDAIQEESRFNLAEQLERLVPFVGGHDHVGLVLDILVKLACEDELVVRDRAVEAMQKICEDLNEKQCEKSFFPIVESLMDKEWFTIKCSAGCLIAICYGKMPQDKQTELINYFRNLIQDEAPMVRRSTATSLIDLLPLLNEEQIKADFVPIFDNLSQDDQDSVKALAVDVGVAIAKRFKDYEIFEFLMATFKTLAEDESWRVRQRIAWKISEVEMTEKTRDELVEIYTKCVRDEETEVRVFAAKNVYNLANNLLQGFKDKQDAFEKYLEENVIPEVHLMLRDPSDDVRVALSTNILSLSTIIRDECFNNNILPLVIDALENEEFMPFKENMLKNLNNLPVNVDITKSIKSIKNVIQNLLENSQMHWRTRRNLLLAFMHICKTSTSEYFDNNLKYFYHCLLSDPIYAIRRTAPTILPVLMKQFGSEWAEKSLIPIFRGFSGDSRYIFRYVSLFAVEEMIYPTIDQSPDYEKGKYLSDFQHLIPESLTSLAKIIKLNQKLEEKLGEIEDNFESTDNIIFYGEDTLENLKKEQKNTIFSVNNADACYLEGVLTILLKDLVDTVKTLLKDPITNVQERAKRTLAAVKKFCEEIKKESEVEWVQTSLKTLSDEDLKQIEEEIEKKLVKNQQDEDEGIDCAILEELEKMEAYVESVEVEHKNDESE